MPLERLTAFRQAGQLHTVAIVESMEELASFVRQHPCFFTIGRGSNALVLRDVFDVPFLQLGGGFHALKKEDKERFFVGGSVRVHELMNWCAVHHITGFEFMAGVPASLGGMVAMNFGCWGVQMQDRIHTVTVYIPGEGPRVLSRQECFFSYRSSVFQRKPWLILGATLQGIQSEKKHIKQTVSAYIAKRLSKQPLRAPTFGSMFKNPPGQIAAAVLIEKAGLKNYRLGNVRVSNQHANFMVNLGHATGEEGVELLQHIVHTVVNLYDITLQPEVSIFDQQFLKRAFSK